MSSQVRNGGLKPCLISWKLFELVIIDDEYRVRFSGLSRTQAGIYPAETYCADVTEWARSALAEAEKVEALPMEIAKHGN